MAEEGDEVRVARRRGERSGKREGEEREELEKKEKKEGAPAAESSRICTWTRLSVEPLQPDLAGLRGGNYERDGRRDGGGGGHERSAVVRERGRGR